jgi:tetratricopeptide (TPR) repeat protein
MRIRLMSIMLLFCCCLAPVYAQTRPDALASYNTGRDLESRGRMDDATTYYNEAVRICQEELAQNANNIESYVVLTWTLQRQLRYNDVISYGERALRINANEYRINEIMGEAYFYLDRWNDSMACMRRYVDANPRGGRASVAYFFIGEIFRYQQKYHYADIAYTTAVQLERYNSLWWYRLGSVREAAQEYGPAAEAYRQALNLNPNYGEASSGLERTRNRA